MSDQPDPPRKHYKFKPKEFENVNGVRREQPLDHAQPAPDPGIVETDKARIDLRDILKAANAVPTTSLPKPATRSNEIHAVLRDNLAHANAAGLNRVDPTPRRASRRKRDYWISLLIGNLVLAGCTVIMPIYGAAGLIIFNVGLTWIMWFVMDDY